MNLSSVVSWADLAGSDISHCKSLYSGFSVCDTDLSKRAITRMESIYKALVIGTPVISTSLLFFFFYGLFR